ncbi:transcriptional regulator [Longimycelium tulufanense]|uniref:Transcriptional regulator n=1 Tax=Longimycelium tulufanense TaxID=907463 RepID=A0A8J3CC46_9PSEU|nr:helix-turn-helix transcriptional regulator [Longimycelium tulufanense]GGM45879.1 transcriptional regulator [Longimycelium tulufanense]
MEQVTSPTVARKQLAAELRAWRKRADLKLVEVAARVPWTSKAMLSRIETGQRPADVHEVRDLLNLYGVDGEARDRLLHLSELARERGWWQQPGNALPSDFRNYVGYEAEACEILWYEPLLLPALLQTEPYARALIENGDDDVRGSELARRVRARMKRTRLLTQEDPISLRVVVDGSVIRRPIGGPAVLRHQLSQLLTLVDRPNVTFQVIPSTIGAHPGTAGWFCVLRFADPEAADMAYTDGRAGNLYMVDPKVVHACTLAFERLSTIALNPSDSVALVKGVIDELPEGAP